MYRHVAQFIHYPSEINYSKLTALIGEFREQSQQHGVPPESDEHEYVMDYR